MDLTENVNAASMTLFFLVEGLSPTLNAIEISIAEPTDFVDYNI